MFKIGFWAFWLKCSKSVEWFCGNSSIFVKSCENSILIIITHHNSILLNNFSLWYMSIFDIFTKISRWQGMSADRPPPLRWEWNHSILVDEWRYADISYIGGWFWNMIIPAIWDVIWGLVDLFPTFNRPPNTFRPKDQHSKKIIFTHFQPLTETAVIACKVLSKESHPQVKNLKNFFPETRSQRVLMGFWWLLYEKASIWTNLKGCKIIFSISINLTPLWYPECSTCKLPQNRTEMHFFSKNQKIDLRMRPIEKSLLGIESPYLWPLFKPMLISKKILKVMALKMLFFRICVFDAKSWKWFFPKSRKFVRIALNTKRIDVFLYKSVILNKFSL